MKVRMYESKNRSEHEYLAFIYVYEQARERSNVIHKYFVDAFEYDIKGTYDVFGDGYTFYCKANDINKFDYPPKFDYCEDVIEYYIYFNSDDEKDDVLSSRFADDIVSCLNEVLEEQGFDANIASVFVDDNSNDNSYED